MKKKRIIQDVYKKYGKEKNIWRSRLFYLPDQKTMEVRMTIKKRSTGVGEKIRC